MIVVCGEALIDLVPAAESDTWRAIPGGGPANSAIAATALGLPAALACRLSDDVFGRQLRRHLGAAGVDLRFAVPAAEPATLAVVSFDGPGAAEYGFYVNGTADWQWRETELPPADLPEVQAIHCGTLAAVLPPGAELLQSWARAQRDRVVVSYDVNTRAAASPGLQELRATVNRWLETAHVVKASEEDVGLLEPDRPVMDVLRDWITEHRLDLVLLTRGGSGASALLPGWSEPVTVPGFAVDVVDTVGAGDTFGAAVLAWLAEHGYLGDPKLLGGLDASAVGRALEFAAAAASLACTAAGAQPPSREEVDRLTAARR